MQPLSAPAVLVLCGLVGLACSAPAGEPAAGTSPPAADGGTTDANDAAAAMDPVGFRASGALREPRAMATATLLLDGRVLIVGGETDDYAMLATVEIYDPATEKVSRAASMPEARSHHTATLLASGEVLVVGGGKGSQISIPNGEGILASAVIYDPSKDGWRATGAMRGARAGHRAVRLAGGRVLVAGGGDHVGYPCAAIHKDCTVADSVGTAEIYDPAAGTFAPTGNLADPRVAFSLDLLGSGRVAVAGGGAANHSLTSVELFDEAAGRWSKGPDLQGQRLFHASGVLGGALVIVGGKIANVTPISTTDVLDEGATAWRRGANVSEPRTGAKLVPLHSGHGLLLGGTNQLTSEVLADARLYDPSANAWTPISPLARGRYTDAVVLLGDGSVVVIGGRDDSGAVGEIERTRTF